MADSFKWIETWGAIQYPLNLPSSFWRDFHADICSEQVEFDPVYEITELENKLETTIPTPSFYRQGNWGLGSWSYWWEWNSCRDIKHPPPIQTWQYPIWMLFRKPYHIFFFFPVKKDVHGGNKKTVHIVKSTQDGSDEAACWKGSAGWCQQQQVLLYNSCHFSQRAENQRGPSCGSMVSSYHLESPAVFQAPNFSWWN